MDENILELQNLCAWYSEGKNVLSGHYDVAGRAGESILKNH